MNTSSSPQDPDASRLHALVDGRLPPEQAALLRASLDAATGEDADAWARQRALLDRWGYPFVMEEFRFHLTLTDRLADPDPVAAALETHFAPVLPRPFVIDDLCLFGEDPSGHFHLLHRYALSG